MNYPNSPDNIDREHGLVLGKEKLFRRLCIMHNIMYMHSDNYKIWARGVITYKSIEAAAKGLPREVAARIWNEIVDNKVNGLETRRSLYWDY